MSVREDSDQAFYTLDWFYCNREKEFEKRAHMLIHTCWNEIVPSRPRRSLRNFNVGGDSSEESIVVPQICT